MQRSWTDRGFWMALGFAAGALALGATQLNRLEATASHTASEGVTMATGSANMQNFEILYVLDDKGTLTAMLVGQNFNLVARPSSLDLKAAFGKAGGKKAKYAMVTGRCQAQGQSQDALYVTEGTSKEVLLILPDPSSGQLRVVQKIPYRQ